MDMVNNVIEWAMEKVDTIFSFFALYSTSYSKWIIYAVILFILSKILKINIRAGR